MASNRRGNTNSFEEGNTSAHNQITARSEANFKWTYQRKRRLIELYAETLAMNNYSLKDPTPYGREFITRKFNEEFNIRSGKLL
ncbi:hypothetical protein ARALYDRAFT_911138 [Arabidopsis lyrata subsp. lyrata]|uniref:Uncharacterized protein n=1 Tax=Arabidopsis lyrata subsp. lyrata TaxID=81972 RepID=D7M8H0_ARALL|nr:hypothetical protein ARALYDRAFT_911138 [Arabidopsis lyrata subsp. lyrata]